jgi:hypothetical protein
MVTSSDGSRQELELLAEEVRCLLGPDERARAGAIEVVAGPATTRDAPDSAVLELSRSPDGLDFALRAVDNRSADAFLDWLNTGDAMRRLGQLDGFALVFSERRAENYADRYTSKRAKWGRAAADVAHYELAAPEIDEDAVDRITSIARGLDARWERPAFTLRASLPVDRSADINSRLAQDLAAHVRALLPILGRVNVAARQAAASRAPAIERASWRAPR